MLKDAVPSPPPPTANCAFSAVLLAGGKSSRMGQDKAGLIIDGQPLWQRQLATLRRVGPHELLISGKADGLYAGAGLEIVPDLTPGLGPLSGLEAALQRASCPRLLVLAIDLPMMNADFLGKLVGQTALGETGVVPRIGHWFEPLAAVYSRHCLPLVQHHLRSVDRSMQTFVRAALSAQLVTVFDIAEKDRALFRNLNTPADLLPR